jgi:hypothetical protein
LCAANRPIQRSTGLSLKGSELVIRRIADEDCVGWVDGVARC